MDDIRGPTSALTSFLREQGITGTIHRRPPAPAAAAPPPAAIAEDSEEEAQNAVAGPSTSVTLTSTSTTTTTTSTLSVSTSSSAKKRKPSAAATAAAAAKKKKQEQEEEGDEDGIFNIAGKKQGAKPGRYDNRTPGSIALCGECGKKFTVTKYTASNPLGPGLLCMPCSNESLDSLTKKTATPAAKRAPKKRAVKSLEEKEYKPVKTLQACCIAVVGKHIEHVEALGDIGPKNLDRIAKIVSKHRALSSANLDLFLDIDHAELNLYDCSYINNKDLGSIAQFCPNLERLVLKMCGRLDNSVLETWGPKLKKLRFLSLYAAFLPTPKGWNAYLETFDEEHQLDGFGLQQSARWDNSNTATLVKHNPNLTYLQLSEIGKMSDISLSLLYPLRYLTSLDISRAGVPEGTVLEDDAVVELLENLGGGLTELVLDQNYNLTDRVLIEGIKIHCPVLRRLSLKGLGEIQSTGLQDLFTSWVNPGLTHLNLARCILLENEAIQAVISHSGGSLIDLNLHSVDNVEEHVLMEMAQSEGKGCSELEVLDVSFVRSVDNFVVKALLEGCPRLRGLFVHGCNRVADDCPVKKGVTIRGLENQKHAELVV